MTLTLALFLWVVLGGLFFLNAREAVERAYQNGKKDALQNHLDSCKGCQYVSKTSCI